MTKFCVVLITTPKGAVAKKMTQLLLERRLAACVSIIPAISSHYWWKGKIKKGTEALLIVKARKSLFKKLAAEVTRAHPYSVPEIVALPLLFGNKPYLKWLFDETSR